jgi:guanylate kinase
MAVRFPKLIIVAAPSGAGKTTLCRKLLQEFPEEMALSISTTTRDPRPGEQDGREYFFCSRTEFESKIARGEFAEWARVHERLYGTSRDILDRTLESGKSVLLDIDVQGAASLRAAYAGRTFSVFVVPPSMEVLEARLRARQSESEEAIALRLQNARAEMKRASEFDKVLINDTFEHAYAQLRQWVLEQTGSLHT